MNKLNYDWFSLGSANQIRIHFYAEAWFLRQVEESLTIDHGRVS